MHSLICISKKSKSIKTFVLGVDNRRKPIYNRIMNNPSVTGSFMSLIVTVFMIVVILFVLKKFLKFFQKLLDKFFK